MKIFFSLVRQKTIVNQRKDMLAQNSIEECLIFKLM